METIRIMDQSIARFRHKQVEWWFDVPSLEHWDALCDYYGVDPWARGSIHVQIRSLAHILKNSGQQSPLRELIDQVFDAKMMIPLDISDWDIVVFYNPVKE